MGKGTGIRGHGWLLQPAVAVAYALAYMAIHPLSDAHWSLTSGFRFACLLLIPYRYWFALAVGEAVPLIYSVLQCVSLYGYTTAAIFSIPPIVVAMPIVWFCREHLKLFPTQRIIDMKTLLICALATSLTWALVTYAGFLTATVPTGNTEHISPIMITGMFVGNYVAILTLATWPLLAKIAYNTMSWKTTLSGALSASLTFDTLLIAVPSLVVLAWISVHIGEESKAILQMSLFLPVAWLALKYGWRGAAASGPLAIACICALTQSVPDPVIIQTQAFVAFAVTCLYLTGARIAAQLHFEERERHAVRNALRVAQQCLYQGEMRLRQTANALELVGGAVSITQSRVLDRARNILTPDERHSLSRQATTTQNQLYRLAESIHPVAWRERGLPAALRETIGRALEEAGIAYACAIHGRGLSQLAPAVHQSIYRIACEAITHVSTQQTCSHIRLTLRGGQTNGRRWAVLCIVGTLDTENLAHLNQHRQSVSAKLGASGSDVASLSDQVALFNGMVHVKRKDESVVVSMLLHDAQHLSLDRPLESQAEKMWVR